MDDERSCDGSVFQTVGAATWKLRQTSCVLVEGTSMSWRSTKTNTNKIYIAPGILKRIGAQMHGVARR